LCPRWECKIPVITVATLSNVFRTCNISIIIECFKTDWIMIFIIFITFILKSNKMNKLLFLIMMPVLCFGQQKDIYKNALPLINKYFPNNELVQNKLQGFYVKFESCRDTNTVDWLISKQTELCALLTSSIELGFDPDTDQTRRRAYETYQLLNKALPCFSRRPWTRNNIRCLGNY